MTYEEKRAITLLRACRMVPRTFAKTFTRNMAGLLDTDPARVLSEKQHETLLKLMHNYRNQHKACFCEECEKARREAKLQRALPL